MIFGVPGEIEFTILKFLKKVNLKNFVIYGACSSYLLRRGFESRCGHVFVIQNHSIQFLLNFRFFIHSNCGFCTSVGNSKIFILKGSIFVKKSIRMVKRSFWHDAHLKILNGMIDCLVNVFTKNVNKKWTLPRKWT